MPLEYALQHSGKFAPASPWKFPPAFAAKLAQELGIKDIPNQKIRRFKQRPFTFNIMVVGESGLGKTTLLNTLFSTDLKEEKPRDLLGTRSVTVAPHRYELQEEGITLHLTMVDTPGFGDNLNREENFAPIVNYVMEQYQQYFQWESSTDARGEGVDTRVHAVLYFLAPTGAGLKQLDVKCLQELCQWTNVIPVIAKADSLTTEEVAAQKDAVRRDAARLGLPFYPRAWSQDVAELGELADACPYAVIGSEQFVPSGGKLVRGRTYRWGTVEVENPAHCDFGQLRAMMLQHSLLDLITTTHETHFSKYRVSQLGAPSRRESVLACDDAYEDRVEASRAALREEMVRKEDDMRQTFVAKVRDKETALREQEDHLHALRTRMAQEIDQLKAALEEERLEVEELVRQQQLAGSSKRK